MTDTPRCNATAKNGEPCKAHPLKGSDYCGAHDPALPESARFGSPAQAKEAAKLAGRPPMPKPTDVMRRLVEDNAAVVLRPHFRTLGFDIEVGEDGPRLVEFEGGPAKIYGTSKDGDVRVSNYDDLGAMMAAAERLFDRVYGKPKQQTEITGGDGGPVEIVTPVTRPDAMSAGVLAQRVLPVVAVNGNGGSHN